MPVIDNFEISLFLKLQRAFNDGAEINSYDIAKEYFSITSDEAKKDFNNNTNRFLSSKNMFVLSRAKKLSKEGLISIRKEGKKIYFILNNDKVLLKKHKFPDGLKNAIFIKDLKNKWTIYEI